MSRLKDFFKNAKHLSWESFDDKPKFKSALEKFQDEYVAAVVPWDNKDGFKIKYLYYGTWYKWNLPEDELSKQKRKILWGTILCMVLFAFGTLASAAMSSLALVAFPAMISFLSMLLAFYGVVQWQFCKYLVSRSLFETIDRRIRVWISINAVASAAASIGCCYYMIRYGAVRVNYFGTVLLFAAEATLSFVILNFYRQIPRGKEQNDTIDHIEIAPLKMR